MPHTMYWQALHNLPPIQQDEVRVLWGDGWEGRGIDEELGNGVRENGRESGEMEGGSR